MFFVALTSIFAALLYNLLIKNISAASGEHKRVHPIILFAIPFISLYNLYFVFGFSEYFVFSTTATLILISIFLTDALFTHIPNTIVLPAIGAIFAFQIFRGTDISDILIAALLLSGFFLLQYIISSGRWIGTGDIWLGVLIGLMLGLRGTIVTLFLAYIGGALFAATLLIFKKKDHSSKIPFGTFLTAAAYISLLFGQSLSTAYLHLIAIR